MEILVLDDDPARGSEFTERIYRYNQKALGDYHLDVASSVKECMQHLQDGVYYLIFLDHDLGGKQMVSPLEEDTGSELVRWLIARRSINMVNRQNLENAWFVLHTYNEEGAKYMEKLLLEHTNRVIVAPGAWLPEPFSDVMREIYERS